jgi:hypothetical protein
MRIGCFAVLCLLLALPGWAGVLFDDGPVNGTYNAFFIDGPGGPFGQTVSDEFVATGTGTADSLDFGMWVPGGSTPTTVSWAIGTSWFSSDISSGFDVQVGYTFVNSNGDGYDVYLAQVDGLSGALVAGNTYYLTLGNGNDTFGDQYVGWDVNEGPASCFFAQSGTPIGGCGDGGEAFTLHSAGAPGVPEPASLVLFGSGLLLLGGLLRRKLG